MDITEASKDSGFVKTCVQYGLPIERGIHVAQNELRGWSSDELSAILDKIDGLPAALDTVRRPYSWQAQHWVKPATTLVERAANEQLALCVNVRGDWQLLENGYVALSHVWDEGLYADPGNRGLPRSIIEQLGNPDGAKSLRLHESLKRVLNPDTPSRTSILDIALSSGNRCASRDIDYCRGFYPCLGLKWNTRFSRDYGMQYIMESRKEEAPLLLGLHGSPLLIEGYAWAPAYLCGLSGTPLLNVSWEQNGLRRQWYSYPVTSNQEKQLPESMRRGALLLGVAGPEGMVSCACELGRRERSEAVIGFKMAIENQSAFLLSELSLEALAKYQRPGPPPTVLLVKQASVDNEAFIYMTAALSKLSGGVPASPKEWLIYHQSPLLEAKISDNPATTATSVKGNDHLPHDGESPLHTAARLSDVAAVRRIISLPCNIDAEDAAGWTPLQIASYLNHLQVVQVLLEGEASIGHIGHDDGLAALHLAIMAQNIECVKALLGARADANILTSGKLTPLMLAAELGSPEVVQQLIYAGARVDYACQRGRGTPLHAAVQSDSIAVLKLLLESPGARQMLHWRDATGSSAYSLALKKADIDAMNLLKQETGFFQLLWHVQYCVYLLAILVYVSLLLGLATWLALDISFLVGQMHTILNHFLSSLWGRDMTPVARPLYTIIILLAARRRLSLKAARRRLSLMLQLWVVLFVLVRLLPFQRLSQLDEAESVRWSTHTVIYSRLLVRAIPLLEVGWLVIKKLGPFIVCALITGGLFRYFREIIVGRSSSQSARAMERREGLVASFITFFSIGALLNISTFYLCWLIALLCGKTMWQVSLHVVTFTCVGIYRTRQLRQFYLVESTHGLPTFKVSLFLAVQHTLSHGAFQWFMIMVLLRLLLQDSLLPGEVLLGGMTGESKMQTYIHRLVLWFTFGRLNTVFSKQWATRARFRLNAVFLEQWATGARFLWQDIQQRENMGWAALLFCDATMGAQIYCLIVATLTVGKILWDCLSTGLWMTGLQMQWVKLNSLLKFIRAGPY